MNCTNVNIYKNNATKFKISERFKQKYYQLTKKYRKIYSSDIYIYIYIYIYIRYKIQCLKQIKLKNLFIKTIIYILIRKIFAITFANFAFV